MACLDGLTILRYGHAYDGGGGMELYLSDLNRALHARNRLTTVQVQMTSDPARVGEEETPLGLGRFVRVSLFVDSASHERAIAGGGASSSLPGRCKSLLRERVLTAPGIYPLFTRRWLASRRLGRRDGEPADAGRKVADLVRRFQPGLICLHSAGGADSAEVIAIGHRHRIPVGYVHHFSNDRLASPAMRWQLEQIAGVAVVNAMDVPAFLRNRFHNVSDGVDTEFYRRELARPLNRAFRGPVIFLPARLTPTKGQSDLLRVAGVLLRRGLRFHLALAGRCDSEEYLAFLHELVRKEGLVGRVDFLGQLEPAELRDWYAASAIMAFPTRHHEGLGRISLEAQALGAVPVVYRIGGTPEGLLDRETGLLVDLGDQASLAECLHQLLVDESRRNQMSRAGRAFVETHFSLATLGRRHERWYADLREARNWLRGVEGGEMACVQARTETAIG